MAWAVAVSIQGPQCKGRLPAAVAGTAVAAVGNCGRRLGRGNVEDAEWRRVGERPRQELSRDVVNGDTGVRFALGPTAMRVAVDDQRHAIRVDRLLEPARSQEGIDLR